MSTNKYIRFVDIASQVIKESRIPLYSRKFSKRAYNQHQLLILLLLKEYIGEDSSVLKRKFGESLKFKSRKYRLQVKEIKIKVILYEPFKMDEVIMCSHSHRKILESRTFKTFSGGGCRPPESFFIRNRRCF